MDNDQLIQGKSMTPFHSQTKKQIIKLMKHQMDIIPKQAFIKKKRKNSVH